MAQLVVSWFICDGVVRVYPPPPRSGNAFAAAVFAAIPGLLLLIVLFVLYAR
jgi:hypothetical protein